LSSEEQSQACDNHLVLPALLEGFNALESGQDRNGDDWIDFYTDADGTTAAFGHGCREHDFSTRELMTLTRDALLNPTIKTAKDLFGGIATYCGEDILERYPESDSRTIWSGPASDLINVWYQKYGEDLTTLAEIARSNMPSHSVAEYEGGRIAVAFIKDKHAEIREGVE
jgi:hypothetical protein